jgi:hypothetical protein
MPRRHDGHDNVSPLATRRERQGNDVIDGGATHLGTFNDSAPERRERQRNEPNDGIDGGATHLDVQRLGSGAASATAQRAQRRHRRRRDTP